MRDIWGVIHIPNKAQDIHDAHAGVTNIGDPSLASLAKQPRAAASAPA